MSQPHEVSEPLDSLEYYRKLQMAEGRVAVLERERDVYAEWAKGVGACVVAAVNRAERAEAHVTVLEHAARALLDRKDFWRNAGTLPGEYDNLVDVLGVKPVEAHGDGWVTVTAQESDLLPEGQHVPRGLKRWACDESAVKPEHKENKP